MTPRDLLGVALVLGLALAMRLFDITDEPLWLDEGYSWWDAQQGFPALWQLVPQCDPHPPFYALLLKGWVGLFGDRILSLRGLSTLFSVAATFFVLIAGRLIDARLGWIAGVLFALTPFQIEFAQEARPYALVALGAAILLYGVLRIFHRRDFGGAGGWIALVVGALISLWSNNTAVFTVAAMGLVIGCLVWRDAATRVLLRPLMIAALVIAVCWMPYLPVYWSQAQGISNDFWIPRPDAWRVFNELRFVHAFGSFAVLDFLLPLWAIGLYCLWRDKHRRAAWILLGLFVLPAGLNLAVSLTVKPIYLARALIGIAPAFTVALAAAFLALKGPRFRLAVLAIYGFCCVTAAAQTLYLKNGRKEPWDRIAAALVENAEADTLVLTVPNEMVLPLRHALAEAGRSLDIQGVPADFPAPGLAARYPSGKCAPAVVGQDLSGVVRRARESSTVLFLTRQANVYDSLDQVRPLLEAAGFTETSRRRFLPGNIEMHRFEAAKIMQAAK